MLNQLSTRTLLVIIAVLILAGGFLVVTAASNLVSEVSIASRISLSPNPSQTAPPATSTSVPVVRPSATNKPSPTKMSTLASSTSFTPDQLHKDGNNLVVQNLVTGQKELLLEPPAPSTHLEQFITSSDGKTIALEYIRDGSGALTLELFDARSRQVATVYQGIAYGWLGMSISPDGQWLAYIPQKTLPASSRRRAPGLAIAAVHPLLGGAPEYGVVYVTPINQPNHSVEVGFCGEDPNLPEKRDQGCKPKITWAPDSASFVWADVRGIWLYRRDGQSRLIIANQKDKKYGYLLNSYLPIAWSPHGRYLRVSKTHNTAVFEIVLDTATSRTGEFPYRLGFDIPSPKIEWLEDGRLLVTQDVVPSIHDIWRIDPASESLLVLDSDK